MMEMFNFCYSQQSQSFVYQMHKSSFWIIGMEQNGMFSEELDVDKEYRPQNLKYNLRSVILFIIKNAFPQLQNNIL